MRLLSRLPSPWRPAKGCAWSRRVSWATGATGSWLWPAPIVARVMTGTAVLHADPRAWLAREIDVGNFLAGTGAPVVAPTSTVDPGPYASGGLWLSLWEHAR